MAKVKCDMEEDGKCVFRKDGLCTADEISIDFDGQYWHVDCPQPEQE